eukprot:gene7253-biopygen17063
MSRSKNDEYEVILSCMTGKEDVLASQDIETLERLLAKVDMDCLRKAILDKCVQRECNKARDAATECSICLSTPKNTCLHPCGHMELHPGATPWAPALLQGKEIESDGPRPWAPALGPALGPGPAARQRDRK